MWKGRVSRRVTQRALFLFPKHHVTGMPLLDAPKLRMNGSAHSEEDLMKSKRELLSTVTASRERML